MSASLRSTSRSCCCEMISISLRRSSTFTSRISLRHCVRILSRLMREYFSSDSCRFLSSFLRPSSLARFASSSFMRSISKRSCRSCAVSGPFFPSTTLEPPFIAFLIFAIAPALCGAGATRLEGGRAAGCEMREEHTRQQCWEWQGPATPSGRAPRVLWGRIGATTCVPGARMYL